MPATVNNDSDRLQTDHEPPESNLWLRTRELDLRERDLAVREAEVKRHDPQGQRLSFVGAIIGALLAFGSALGASVYQGNSDRILEREKFESSLISQAVSSPDTNQSIVNLRFLLRAGLVRRNLASIQNITTQPDSIPYLRPSSTLGYSPAPEPENHLLTTYLAAVEKDPQNAMYNNLLGYTYLRMGNVPLAISHLQRSVEVKPEYIWGHYNLALAYAAASQWESAVAEVKTVLRQNPEFKTTIQRDNQFARFREQKAFCDIVSDC